MKTELHALHQRLVVSHVLVTALLLMLGGAALWEVHTGAEDHLLWAAASAAALAGSAILLRCLPGRTIAKVLDIVRRFNGRLGQETTPVPARLEMRAATNSLVADLRRNVERAEHAREILSTFLGAASQELRQPVAALRGWLELAQCSGCNNCGCQTAIGEALKQADQVSQLCRLLLQFGQAECPSHPCEKAQVDSLVKLLAKQVPVLAEARKLKVAIECEGGGAVRGNPVLLEQAILDVIQNAINYSPQGGNLHVSVFQSGQDTCLAVTDDGPGIPREKLERIFEPFYGSGSTSEIAGSRGLAIAKLIIEAAGGKIQVESQPGHGNSFRIRLPLAI